MKRILGIGLSIVVFLAILGAILFKVLGPSQTLPKPSTSGAPLPVASNTTSTDALAKGTEECISAYMASYDKIRNAEIDPSQTDPFRSCFSANFISQWSAIREETESDPLFFIGDLPASWQSSVHAQVISVDTKGAVIKVMLGTGSEQSTITLHEVVSNGVWQINGSLPPQ